MTVWYHQSTIFNRRHALRYAGLLALCVALITTLLFNVISPISHAAAGVNQTLSFQGRLLSSNGGVVPDGYYNIQFKIYQDGDGTTAGDTGGSLKWTETYINNGGNNGVEVKDGFFSVNLGSLNPFGTSVDWDQDTLWLSMNVAGSSTSCTTFNSSPCVADGEMLPMKRITSTPYSLNSGELGGKTASNFIQLAQGVQTDASTNTSSIFINKTSTGNLIQLQNTATDVFTVGNSGDLTFGSNADKTISIATAAADTNGNDLSVLAGGGGSGSGSNGGTLTLQGGAAGGTNGDGGNISINAGAGSGSGSDGSITIGGNHTSSVAVGGDTLYVGNADSSGQAASATDFTIQGTTSTGSDMQGGSINLQAGSATSGNANGGNVTLSGGSGSGTGATGLVVINTPTFQTASQQSCSTDCTITQSSIDNNGALSVDATATGLTVSVNAPTITTAGRIVYVTAASGSDDFTLSMNGGGSGNLVTMRQNTTATLIWNGSAWTVSGASDSTFFSINSSGVDGVPNVQIGSSSVVSTPTLLTLGKSASAPTITDSSLIGSMYYDTTLGELQCYESTGWGACTNAPDSFVSLSHTYTGAVVHATGTGTLTTDFCSDSLNINNGTSSQPLVCGSNETYNYYNWTSIQPSSQTRSIYVTYQLPSNFKNFVANSTSLMGLTDSSDAAVGYQIYRSDGSGLTACGSTVSVSTGTQTSWQKGSATSTEDPSNCSFVAGDSIVIRIDLSSANSANAYVSTLDFAYSNND